jgi:hypothetical protein
MRPLRLQYNALVRLAAVCLIAVILLTALPPMSGGGARACCCLKAAASCPLMSHVRGCESRGLSCAVQRHDEPHRANIRNDSDLTLPSIGVRAPDRVAEFLTASPVHLPATSFTPETPPPRFA